MNALIIILIIVSFILGYRFGRLNDAQTSIHFSNKILEKLSEKQ